MNSSLPSIDDLVHSAGRFARRALDSHNSKEFELVPLFAVTAIEHSSKACLMKVHPSLLVALQGEDNFESLLFLVGARESVPDKFFTVSLTVSLRRLKGVFRSKANSNHIDELIKIRNGEIHIANSSEVETELLVAFIEQMQSCLAFLEFDEELFWQEHLEVTTTLLQKGQDKLKQQVKLKIQQSDIRFKKLTEKLSAVNILLLQEDRPWTFPPINIVTCPVCKCKGYAMGHHEVRTPILYKEESGGISKETPSLEYVWFEANGFECPKCGLRLDSRDEMTEAGITTEFTSNYTPSEVTDSNVYRAERFPQGLSIPNET